MKVTVELTGAARAHAGVKTLSLDLPDTATYRDIVRELAKHFPQLVGWLIAPDGESFLSSNMLVINGDLATPVMVLDENPADGEHLILMSVITGG
ncbi:MULTISPECIES: MoaD/ThiS family protein [Anaerolinea]|uniref:ThiS family protein n=1 Tax=Anaerolinea thermophila (strain DSM 14523 / JCM 11388 / NBRC 100420 / UNI-1) TaxID=926569 RepID=E8N1J2_ANATU|nr:MULTISPECIES: MoaD/ThiS family protein [Anaerolinea]BAJ62597.1 hypothetical protein ANT_05630 [Anaerolinea thermophila UNI-1]